MAKEIEVPKIKPKTDWLAVVLLILFGAILAMLIQLAVSWLG